MAARSPLLAVTSKQSLILTLFSLFQFFIKSFTVLCFYSSQSASMHYIVLLVFQHKYKLPIFIV